MRLRQICFVAHDLEKTLDQFCDLLQAEVCFRDPGVGHFGLANGLIEVGGDFLEVVSPTEEGTTAGRYLDSIKGTVKDVMNNPLADLSIESKLDLGR